MNKDKQNKILFAFNVIIFLILLSLSIPILVQIFSQFFSESSTFKQSEELIKEFPTITICTASTSFEYGVDINISMGMHDYVELIQEGEHQYSWKKNGNFVENINLEKFQSLIVAGYCYKITKNITYDIVHMNDGYNSITVNFNKSIPYDELPNVDIFFTSEKNSPGVLKYEWMDGNELHLKIPKEKWKEYDTWVKIKQEKYQYLRQTIFNTKGDCIEKSFYECAVEETINNNFEGWNCTKNCFSSALITSGALDKKYECEDDEQELCSFYAFDTYNANCSKPCSIVQYNGKIDLWESNASNQNDSSFVVYLRFAPPLTSTLYEEYVIYDVFGMIGSVGGTLGIFIGFSCSSLMSLITDILKKQKLQKLKEILRKFYR